MNDGHRPLKNLAIIADIAAPTLPYIAVPFGLARPSCGRPPTPLVHMADVTASTLDILAPVEIKLRAKKKEECPPLYIDTAVALANRHARTGHASRLIDTGRHRKSASLGRRSRLFSCGPLS